ncbi:MAG: DUF362 domain-containing protein [Candidatus Bathyarchaeia archaeon]
MVSKVYFVDFRMKKGADRKSVLEKIDVLFEESGLGKIFECNDIVAIKVHFGTLGSTRYLRPVYIRRIVENVKKRGGDPFVTETCGLGHKERSFAHQVIKVAAHNGFTHETVGAPIICADGIMGVDCVEVPIDGLKLKKAHIASALAYSHAIISVAHAKLHPGTGVAGAIKNLGIGAATKLGKAEAHMIERFPQYSAEKCSGCGKCLKWCPTKAITLVNRKALFDWTKCISCLSCVDICREYNREPALSLPRERFLMGEGFLEGIIDNFSALVKVVGKEHIGYINFITEVTPHCDCPPYSDTPIVSDIGILAAQDPVAIDKCSADLINASQGIRDSVLGDANKEEVLMPGFDKIKYVTGRDWLRLLRLGEKVGLGSLEYELVKIDV